MLTGAGLTPCLRIIEKNMETTIRVLGPYRDNGKEHGNYHIVHWGYIQFRA